MASGFVFGILIKKYQNLLLAAAACVMAGIVLYVLLSEPKARRTLRIWLLCYIGFFFLGTMRFGQKEALTAAYEAVIRDGMEATVQGTLSGKEWKGEQFVYHLKDCYILVGQEVLPCDRILFYQQTDAASVGQILIVEGTIALWESARNEGNFDAKAFYRSKNIGFSIKNASIKELHGRTDGIGERLFCLREQIRNVYQSYLSEEDAGVLETMTMGDKSLLDAGTKQMYQKAGISHILAISGVKTLKLDIPLVLETRINWGFVPLHIAIIYILKLCLGEEIIPRCRFPCSRGYLIKCINWQKKQSFSVSQSYRKS